MIAIQYLGLPMTPWRSLVMTCPDSEFESGTRSTLPLLEYWRDSERALEEMRRNLGVALVDASLKLEHRTPVQGGRGKASHTDLMIDAQDVAVAVEAKFNEPPYETVAEWSGTAPTSNRQDVLGGWLRLIAAKSGVELSSEQVAPLPYQLIHRAASACAMSQGRAIIVYHLFGADHVQYYRESMKALADACHTDRLRFVLLESPATQVSEYSALLGRLNADPRRAALIRNAMLEAPAYSFGHTVATSIN
jgi:hypothetical protein